MFFEVREVPGLKKKPSTSELLDWLKLLLAEDIPPEALRSKDRKTIIPPLHGALLKNEQDVDRRAGVARGDRRCRGADRRARAFRPPVSPFGGGGELGPHLLNEEAVQTLKEKRMSCVLWNAIPRDWPTSEGRVGARAAAPTCTVLVLHDLPTGAMRHLAGFVAAVRQHGGIADFPSECSRSGAAR